MDRESCVERLLRTPHGPECSTWVGKQKSYETQRSKYASRLVLPTMYLRVYTIVNYCYDHHKSYLTLKICCIYTATQGS